MHNLLRWKLLICPLKDISGHNNIYNRENMFNITVNQRGGAKNETEDTYCG